MALISAHATLDTGVEKNRQRAVLAQQLAHFRQGHVLPVIDQFTWKTQALLVFRLSHKGSAVDHGIALEGGRCQQFTQRRCLEFDLKHNQAAALGAIGSGAREIPRPRCDMAVLTRDITHVTRRAEKNAGRMK